MFSNNLTVLCAIFVAVSLASGTPVEECGNGVPKPIHAVIEGCDEPPCRLERGRNVVMLMNFTAPNAIDQLEAKTSVKFMDYEFNYYLPESDGCNGLTNTHCPLEQNEPAIYRLEVPILEKYHKGIITVTFSMTCNGNQKEFLCFKTNCQVD